LDGVLRWTADWLRLGAASTDIGGGV